MLAYPMLNSGWIQDTICSSLPAVTPALTTGSVANQICFTYGDPEHLVSFNPITMSGCADPGSIIGYEATVDTLDAQYFKVSIDPYNN